MFTLAFHIVAISLLLAFVAPIAYKRGFNAGQRRLRRELGLAPDNGRNEAREPLA